MRPVISGRSTAQLICLVSFIIREKSVSDDIDNLKHMGMAHVTGYFHESGLPLQYPIGAIIRPETRRLLPFLEMLGRSKLLPDTYGQKDAVWQFKFSLGSNDIDIV